jgi:tRNA(fMet)-specific endonuclease VapC
MQPVLLDTDILNEVLKQKNANVIKRAADYLSQQQQFAISGINWYEVVRGLREKGALKQVTKFEQFCRHSITFAVSHEILDRAANLWVAARKGGHPDKDADLIIAATALEHGRILVTGAPFLVDSRAYDRKLA